VLAARILQTDAPLDGTVLLAVAWNHHPQREDTPASLEVRASVDRFCSPRTLRYDPIRSRPHRSSSTPQMTPQLSATCVLADTRGGACGQPAKLSAGQRPASRAAEPHHAVRSGTPLVSLRVY
jgi:hypothetical protein